MTMWQRRGRAALPYVAVVAFSSWAVTAHAALLVADRLSNSVYRYSNSGTYLNKVITDNANLIQPSGLAISPDSTKMYVASSGNSQVMQYDFNATTGVASNPVVFADSTDGLSFPNSILFSPSGNTIYVSNLGGTGVARFNTDGSSAGAPLNGLIGGGAFFQFSGMTFAPSGELIVGAFQDFPAGTSGAVAKSNAALTSLGDFVAPSTALNGVTGLLVQGFNLYVAAGFSGNIRRYNVSTGELDAGFGLSGLEFPQGLVNAPDGNGFLAGILGFVDGTGKIARYDFNGTLLGTFAAPQPGGLREPTAMAFVAIPEPSSLGLVGVALGLMRVATRRRRAA